MDLFSFDDAYIRRLRDGDPATVGHYVEYFKVPLKMKLRRRGMRPEDIEDVIQTTHLKVFQQLHSAGGVRDSHAFGAMVHTTCTHAAQEFERKRRETVELEPDDNFDSGDEDVLRKLIRKETRLRVRRVLQSMAKEDKRDADILTDLFISELDKDAICRKHGVGRDYLRVLVHRALKKFEDEYDPDDS